MIKNKKKAIILIEQFKTITIPWREKSMGAWNWIEKDQKNWTKSTNKGKRINYAKRFKIKK
jgi:hypothetical protein